MTNNYTADAAENYTLDALMYCSVSPEFNAWMEENRSTHTEPSVSELYPSGVSFSGRTCRLTPQDRLAAGNMAFYNGDIPAVMEEYNISRSYAYKLRRMAIEYSRLSADPTGTWVKIDENFRLTHLLLLKLECGASYSDCKITEDTLFGESWSVGKMSELIHKYAEKAREFNKKEFPEVLKYIDAIAADEIFQGDVPVFTVIDPYSTFIVAITAQNDRKAVTWQALFNSLYDQGLDPEVFISDASGSLFSAAEPSFPGIWAQKDTFHILYNLGRETSKVIRDAEKRLNDYCKLEKSLSGKSPREKTYNKWLKSAKNLDNILLNADNLETLSGFLRELVGFSGYSEETTVELIKWVLDEMLACVGFPKDGNVPEYRKKFFGAKEEIESFRSNMSENLRYLNKLYVNLDETAAERHIRKDLFREVYELRRYNRHSEHYRNACIRIQERYDKSASYIYDAEAMVREVIRETPRASSLVENLNSRVRVILNAQHVADDDFLVLLQLYLNLRPYPRSEKSERVGKSPYELLTGRQANFFEVLGIGKCSQYSIAS